MIPIIVPIVVFLVSLYLIVAPVINNPDWAYLFVLILACAGLVFYIPIHVFKVKILDKPIEAVTLHLQSALQLAPHYVPKTSFLRFLKTVFSELTAYMQNTS